MTRGAVRRPPSTCVALGLAFGSPANASAGGAEPKWSQMARSARAAPVLATAAVVTAREHARPAFRACERPRRITGGQIAFEMRQLTIEECHLVHPAPQLGPILGKHGGQLYRNLLAATLSAECGQPARPPWQAAATAGAGRAADVIAPRRARSTADNRWPSFRRPAASRCVPRRATLVSSVGSYAARRSSCSLRQPYRVRPRGLYTFNQAITSRTSRPPTEWSSVPPSGWRSALVVVGSAAMAA